MDAILILGAAVWPDGPSPTLQRRTAHAAQLWHEGKAPVVIPCGGMGLHPPTEAAAMRILLIGAGVPDAQITLEDQSTNTLENIRNASDLLDGTQAIIVTDNYHAPRARMVARHFGLYADISCPASPHRHLRQHLREALAHPFYRLKLWLEPNAD